MTARPATSYAVFVRYADELAEKRRTMRLVFASHNNCNSGLAGLPQSTTAPRHHYNHAVMESYRRLYRGLQISLGLKFFTGFVLGHGVRFIMGHARVFFLWVTGQSLLWSTGRGLLWVTIQGLLSLKVIVGAQEWIL